MNNHDSKKENSVLYLDQSEGPQITSVCYTAAAPGAKVREEEKKIQAVRNCFSFCRNDDVTCVSFKIDNPQLIRPI
jgi:hypothetical protein